MSEINAPTNANNLEALTIDKNSTRIDFDVVGNHINTTAHKTTSSKQWHRAMEVAQRVASNFHQYESMALNIIQSIEGENASEIHASNIGKTFAVNGSSAQHYSELDPGQKLLLDQYMQNGKISLAKLTELLMDADVARNIASTSAQRSIGDGYVDALDITALTGPKYTKYLMQQLIEYSGDSDLARQKIAEGSFSITDKSDATTVLNTLQKPISTGYEYAEHMRKAVNIYQQHIQNFGATEGKKIFFDSLSKGSIGAIINFDDQTIAITSQPADLTFQTTDNLLSFRQQLDVTAYQAENGKVESAHLSSNLSDDIFTYTIPNIARSEALTEQHYRPTIDRFVSEFIGSTNLKQMDNGILQAISSEDNDALLTLLKPVLEDASAIFGLNDINLHIINNSENKFFLGYVNPEEPNKFYINKLALESIKQELTLTGSSEIDVAQKLTEELITTVAHEHFHLFQNNGRNIETHAAATETLNSALGQKESFIDLLNSKILTGGRLLYENTLTEYSAFELTNKLVAAIRAQR